jgi:hypothetical protein
MLKKAAHQNSPHECPVCRKTYEKAGFNDIPRSLLTTQLVEAVKHVICISNHKAITKNNQHKNTKNSDSENDETLSNPQLSIQDKNTSGFQFHQQKPFNNERARSAPPSNQPAITVLSHQPTHKENTPKPTSQDLNVKSL